MEKAVAPKEPEAVKPEASNVVAIVAGTRTGLKTTKSGVLMTNATTEPPRVIAENVKRASAAPAAKTAWIISNIFGMIKLNGWDLIWWNGLWFGGRKKWGFIKKEWKSTWTLRYTFMLHAKRSEWNWRYVLRHVTVVSLFSSVDCHGFWPFPCVMILISYRIQTT